MRRFPGMPALLALPLFFLLALLRSARATLVNITVDDYFTDPINNNSWVNYTPYTSWSLSDGFPCANCTARPDPARAYLGTWHEGLNTGGVGGDLGMYAWFEFEGEAVYVFCIVPRASASPDGNADMTFKLDGAHVGTYTRAANGTDVYEYNVPVYVNASLAPGLHTLELYNTPPPGVGAVQNSSLVLLDYIIYTRDNATEPVPATYTPISVPLPGPTETSGSSSILSTSSGPKFIVLEIVLPLMVFCIFFLLGARQLVPWWQRRKQEKARNAAPSQQFLRSLEQGDGAAPVTAAAEAGQAGWVRDAPLATVAGAGLSAMTEEESRAPEAGPSRFPGARASIERSEDVDDTHTHSEEEDAGSDAGPFRDPPQPVEDLEHEVPKEETVQSVETEVPDEKTARPALGIEEVPK